MDLNHGCHFLRQEQKFGLGITQIAKMRISLSSVQGRHNRLVKLD